MKIALSSIISIDIKIQATDSGEKDKLRYAAIEAMRLGHGGQTCISKIFGCDRKTIRKGIQEMENFPRIVKYDSRIRKRGGGRMITSEVNGKKLDAAFLSVMEPHKAGNPMNEDEFWPGKVRDYSPTSPQIRT